MRKQVVFLKKQIKWKGLIAGVLAVAILAGGGILIRKKMISKAVSVYPISSTMMWGSDDQASMQGEVTDAAMQKIVLRSGLVDSIKVKTGSKVKKGDCLMKYNKESVKLAVQADEAQIALLEAERESANADIQKYQSLHPSEEMPEATEQVIHHKAEPVAVLPVIDVGTAPSEGGNIFYCSKGTVVTAAKLQELDDTDQTAEFRIYENNVKIGSWLVDGAKISSGEKTIYIEKTIIITPDPDPVPDPIPTPDPVQPDFPEGDNGQTSASLTSMRLTAEGEVGGRSEEETRREEKAPYEDWTLGDGVEFNGDGTVSVDYSRKHYGQLSSVVPEEAEWDDVIIIQPDVDTSGGNYSYSRKELAEMIQEKSKELEEKDLEIKEAKLKLEQDKLVSADGKVLAGMDGVVTEVKDPNEIKTGDTLITVKGNSGLTITVHVSEYDIRSMEKGEMLNVTSYETASSFEAEVTDISFEPETGNTGGSQNVTYYPVTATVTVPTIQLNRGEWCQVGRQNLEQEDGTGNLAIPEMFIRQDDQGSYCMVKDDKKHLKKAYVKTGKTMWGSYVEIKYGLTAEDWIAFPYGKNVNVGSPVIEKEDLSDFYN